MATTPTSAGLLRALVWLWASVGALGAEVWIRNIEEFVQFKDDVNSGVSYSGTTVFLDSDMDFTEGTFDPIGNSDSKYFNGIFDGQGHVISNLVISSSTSHVGLFGLSYGLTIKNVIIDSSCSITSSLSDFSSNTFVGGIIGYCNAENGPCIIENSVSMGSVSFSGTISGSPLFLGGIAGELSFSNYNSTVKNCANYGDVTHSGRSISSYIGGIVGDSYGSTYSSSKRVYIYNSLNHGTISHNGTTTGSLYLGGITGRTRYTTIENCVSGGKILSTKKYIGCIVGEVSGDETSVNYCYFTSKLSGYEKYGYTHPTLPSESYVLNYDSTTFELNGTVSIESYTGSSLIDALNIYANSTSLNYSHWLLNKEKKAVSFTINGRTPFTLKTQIMLLPNPADNGERTFSGWFSDENLTTPFTSNEVKSDTRLYGLFCKPVNYTVTLDVNGGKELADKELTIECGGSYGTLPTPTREGYIFEGWFTKKEEGTKIESGDKVTQNHTLYAHWAAKYTVTFDVNGGNPLSESESKKEVTYDKEYGDLPEPTRTGYTFEGWFTDKTFTNEITSELIMSTPNNHTLYAKWDVNNYILTFDLNNGKPVIDEVHPFNDSITYPTNPVREGYTFNGWNDTTEFMPAHNLIITAQWSMPSSGMEPFILAITIGIIIPAVIIIVTLIVVLVFVSRKKRNDEAELRDKRIELSEPLIYDDDDISSVDEGYLRVVASSEEEVVGNSISTKSIQSALSNLYPNGYARATMKEALLKAKLIEEYANLVCSACESTAQHIANRGKLFEGFTKEDAAAVAMYTYDFGSDEFENNPYRIINRSLVGRNYAELQRASDLLYLVMTALRKLPRVTGRLLYRGVRSEVSLDEDHYYKGNIVTWPALSSTSPDMSATKAFLGKGMKKGKGTGTLFIIEGGWGYDIQPYSLFPNEEEIILEPERQFKVTGVIEGDGLTFINLQMLDTPLSIPEVFGSGRK